MARNFHENLTAPFTDWDTLTVPGFIQMQSSQRPPASPTARPITSTPSTPWDGHETPGEIPQDYKP